MCAICWKDDFTENVQDNVPWIQCDSCQVWIHSLCAKVCPDTMEDDTFMCNKIIKAAIMREGLSFR
jgi:ferredoxin